MKHYRYLLTLLISMPFLLVAQDDSEESEDEAEEGEEDGCFKG